MSKKRPNVRMVSDYTILISKRANLSKHKEVSNKTIENSDVDKYSEILDTRYRTISPFSEIYIMEGSVSGLISDDSVVNVGLSKYNESMDPSVVRLASVDEIFGRFRGRKMIAFSMFYSREDSDDEEFATVFPKAMQEIRITKRSLSKRDFSEKRSM